MVPWWTWSLKNFRRSQYILLAGLYLFLNDNFLVQAFVPLEQKGPLVWVVALALLNGWLHILAYYSELVSVVGAVAAGAADAVAPLETAG